MAWAENFGRAFREGVLVPFSDTTGIIEGEAPGSLPPQVFRMMHSGLASGGFGICHPCAANM